MEYPKFEMVGNVPMLIQPPLPNIVLRRPALTFGSLTASIRTFIDGLTRDQVLFTDIIRPDVNAVMASFTPELTAEEKVVLVNWLLYVFDPDKPSTPATLVHTRANSILHMRFDEPEDRPPVDVEDRRRYLVNNNKIDADFTTLSGKGYIDEFNDRVESDPDLINYFFNHWKEWSVGTLTYTLILIMHSKYLHLVKLEHLDVFRDNLPNIEDVTVKDAILDLCASLQEESRYDMGWLLDLDLKPQWIKDYAVIIGTRDTSLHPQKDAE